MQITCNAGILQKAVQLAESVISSRNTLPILQNLVLEVKSKEAVISSSNLEETLIQTVSVNIQEAGAITLDAKKLGDILRCIKPDDEVNIKLENERNVHITTKNLSSSKTAWDLVATSVSEYPKLPKVSSGKSFSISHPELKKMIRKTAFAASTENNRMILNGVCFEISENALKLIATDGRRLAYIQTDCKIGFDFEKIIVPQKVLLELQKILTDEAESMLKISVTEKQIAFEIDNITLISQLIEGEFPNYDQVIPKSQQFKVEFTTIDIIDQISLVKPMASDKVNRIIFSFTPDKLVLTTNDPDKGESRSEMPVSFDSDSPFEIAFQIKYVDDILRVIDTEKILLGLKEPLSPATIKEVGNPDYVCIIMPMKII